MSHRRRNRASRPQVGINLTSLLDITFVLLIAFMIITPVLTRSMDIDLPSTEPPPEAKPPDPEKTIVVMIQYGGGPDAVHPLTVDEMPVADFGELQRIASAWEVGEGTLVSLAIDRRVPYGEYIEAAAALQRAGIRNYQLIYLQKQ